MCVVIFVRYGIGVCSYNGYPEIVKREIQVLRKQAAKDAKLGEGSWGDVFAGDMWKRLLIGWGAQFHQQLTGINVIMMYSVIIFGTSARSRTQWGGGEGGYALDNHTYVCA